MISNPGNRLELDFVFRELLEGRDEFFQGFRLQVDPDIFFDRGFVLGHSLDEFGGRVDRFGFLHQPAEVRGSQASGGRYSCLEVLEVSDSDVDGSISSGNGAVWNCGQGVAGVVDEGCDGGVDVVHVLRLVSVIRPASLSIAMVFNATLGSRSDDNQERTSACDISFTLVSWEMKRSVAE